uniref:Movement protein n=1 Tax=Soybean dwarf virus TaxID=12049 RepID=A0A6M4EK70_9TOMB|nr:movement protein [Soybean dwarf virus]
MSHYNDDALAEPQDALHEFSSWLFQRPVAHHSADEDNDDEGEIMEEEAIWPEDQARLTNSSFRRTVSMAVPRELSHSGRLYQSASHSLMEYSKPTMNIRSRVSYYSSSPRPLPPRQAPSLMSLTHTANTRKSNRFLTNSASPRAVRNDSPQELSMALNGMTPVTTNSRYITRGTESPKSQAPSRSRSMS